MNEFWRPWKLATLALGLVALILGSFDYEAPDWDIPISLIMAFIAYVTAPWSMRVIVERRWHSFPWILLVTWFGVDGCYWLYWSWQKPEVLPLMRDANAPASLSLYCMCGLVWLYRGSLAQMRVDALKLLRKRTP